MASTGSVSVHALSAGYLTLPERFFVAPLEDEAARKTVPSLSFLIQHTATDTGKVTRIVFDLGIRRKLDDYAAPIYKHAMTRQPLSGEPDTVSSLAMGGLTPNDVDIVMFSHLHWDHIGMPSDYPSSTYVIGPGAAKLISKNVEAAVGSHNHFEPGLLDTSRTVELPITGHPATTPSFVDELELTPKTQDILSLFQRPWKPKSHFENAMDIFNDGSVYIVSAPGHLDGHINLLCRLPGGKHIYLAGDACHDLRLLTGEKEIATWDDPLHPGILCCIHKDKIGAERTINAIKEVSQNPGELQEVEVIFAHDDMWAQKAKEQGMFFPGGL